MTILETLALLLSTVKLPELMSMSASAICITSFAVRNIVAARFTLLVRFALKATGPGCSCVASATHPATASCPAFVVRHVNVSLHSGKRIRFRRG